MKRNAPNTEQSEVLAPCAGDIKEPPLKKMKLSMSNEASNARKDYLVATLTHYDRDFVIGRVEEVEITDEDFRLALEAPSQPATLTWNHQIKRLQ